MHSVNILSGNKINVPDVMHFYTEQSKGGKTLVRTEDLLEIFIKNNLFIQQKSLVESIQNSIFSTSLTKTIIYKIENINELKQYQMQHHGELPPLSCMDNLIRIINKQPHPYSYDYIGTDINDIYGILRRLKHILMANIKVYKVSGIAQHPLLNRIKRQGSSRGVQYSLTQSKSCKSLSGLITTNTANVVSQCSESYRNGATLCSPLSARCFKRTCSGSTADNYNMNQNNNKNKISNRSSSAAIRARSPLTKNRTRNYAYGDEVK